MIMDGQMTSDGQKNVVGPEGMKRLLIGRAESGYIYVI
jgi:hypothetical protein